MNTMFADVDGAHELGGVQWLANTFKGYCLTDDLNLAIILAPAMNVCSSLVDGMHPLEQV